MSARQPSRLRAALTARLSLLLCDGNVKKSAGHHRTQPFNRPDRRRINNKCGGSNAKSNLNFAVAIGLPTYSARAES